LYEHARYESIVAFLLTMQPPRDLTRILSWHFRWLEDRFPHTSVGYSGTGVIEAILKCGVRWEERDPERLARIRRSLLKISDYHLKAILLRLERPEICAPETYQELVRTPKVHARLVSLGLKKKPITESEKRKSEREKRTNAIRGLLQDYDRNVLYEQVWSEPVLTVAKGYGVSSVWLGNVCRKLNVPVPPRGYWARVRSGGKGRKPPLPELRMKPESTVTSAAVE
jgi:DNA-binding HxlR family transcriptional regulator